MKLTKKQENDIWQVYDTWLNGYLNGDVKTYNKYLDKDYHFIGSTANEEFLDKKDTTNFFKATADQLAGKCDLRNETKIIEKFEDLVFVTHLFDAWFINGEEFTYYGRFRFTNALKENKAGWRFIYQHFSTPDSKTDEGETIGFDKVSVENQELREAIKRRTFELEQKNRELEIETALERIRAQAVAMKESTDLLDIVVTMRNEFIKLGHEAHYFWHMMWLPKTYEKAMTSGDGSKIGFVMELPRHIHGDIPLLAKWEKSKKPTVVYTMNVEEAIDYVDKMVALGNFKNLDPQAPSHDDIKHIGGLTFIMARTSHGEIGYSLPGIVNKPPKEDIDILVKFASAFDLAHQRFLDLQKAEKQARETQIELSLERIRSRVTAMQESSDLFDIVVTMRNEFLSLGHEADYFWHMKWTKDNYEMSMTAEDGGRLGMVITVPKFVHEQIKSLHQWEKSKSPYFVLALNGKEAWDYIEKMNTYGKYQLVDPHAPTEEDILHIGGLTFIIARTTHGEIGFSLAGKIDNPPKASIDILVRFASVFDLAYKRFEDLKKAEARARETQIELALEKVRSRTMAMQHSDELQEASFLLDQQVRELGIKTWGCAFNIYGENESTEWFGNEAGVLHTYTVPRAGIFKEYYDKGQKGESLFIQEFSGDDCLAHYEYMSSLPVIGDVLKTLKKTNKGFPTYQIDHVVYFKYGYLLFITRESVPEAHVIFKRFAKVFEQTYTRFLDLQKAEEQARESKIEASLERVRSASMAMHKSEEMQIVVDTIFEQLNALNFEMHAVGMSGAIDPKKGYEVWAGGIGLKAPLQIPYSEATKVQRDYNKVLIERIELFAKTYKGKIKKEYIDFLLQNNKFPPSLEKLMVESRAFSTTLATSKNSGMQILRYSEKPYTDTENAILLRFAKVFEQAYIRFMDLQKAEAQAREARIETALERVRSRSMAMHNSDELQDVIHVVHKELLDLNISINGGSFIAINDDISTEIRCWGSGGTANTSEEILIPRYEKPFYTNLLKGIKKGVGFFTESYSHEEKKAFFKHLFNYEPWSNLSKKEKNDTLKSSGGYARSCCVSKHTSIFIINHFGKQFTEAENNILKRFSNVFEQTYTRFLDLQKAEEQAKEAQIEASLERVRSRSMAMHKSEELLEAGSLLYSELFKLGVNHLTAGYILFDEKAEIGYSYGVNPADGSIRHQPVGMIHTQTKTMKAIVSSWKKQEPLLVIELNEKETIKHQTFIAEKSTNFPITAAQLLAISPKRLVIHCFNFKQGYLLIVGGTRLIDEQQEMVVRFAKVFQQTYTRFLDLQKAEEQAKEAQIEAALERVRSRSMAMHKSEEIGDVAFVLFEQLKSLGGELWGTGFGFCKTDSKVDEFWFANEKGIMPHVKIPNDTDEAHKKMYQGWKKKLELFSIEKGGKELKDHYKYMLTVPDMQPIFQGMLDNGIQFPKWQKWHAAYFKYGYILVITTQPYKNETIFKRFAKVFEQAYTRFLDLQKAEAQAKEAQIEAALERVRSRSMAMHKSEEMLEVIEVVAKQLLQLNLKFETVSFGKNNHEGDFKFWIASKGQPKPMLIKVPFLNSRILNSVQEAQKKGISFIEDVFNAKENKEWSEHLIKFSELKHLPKEVLDFILNAPGFARSSFLLNSIDLYVGNYRAVPFTKEENAIFNRFAHVFEQAYTRFLDLQKAEAQARESQIETALERVRSRSMAMHNSEELKDVIQVLYDQFIHLNINIEHAGFILDYKENDDMHIWLADHNAVFPKIVLPYFDCAHWNSFIEAKKTGQNFFVNTLGFEEKNKFYKDLFEHIPDLPEETKTTYFGFKGLAISTVLLDNVGLYIENYSGTPFSEEENNILMRFGKVFQQTYTRFLDLQKAEKQTREAQINLAVERVRAKALAMHKSEEIMEVVTKLKDEVMALDIPDVIAATIFLKEGEEHVRMWDLSSLEKDNNGYQIPFDITFKLKKRDPNLYIKRVWENQDNYFLEKQEAKDFKRIVAWLKENNKNEVADEVEEFIETTKLKRLHHAVKKLNNGKLAIDLLNPPSDEMETILTKMGAAFDLAYKRFEDLKKAEAQAREAEIEAALERIRSRSMAMHKTDELSEVIVLLFRQLELLNLVIDTCYIDIFDEDNRGFNIWVGTGTAIYPKQVHLPYFKHPIHQLNKKARQNNVEFFSIDEDEKSRDLYFEHFYAKAEGIDVPEKRKEHIAKGLGISGSAAMGEHAGITMWNYRKIIYSKEENEILNRVNKVFQQTYTRFLDLKKAETQARESQIEAALERVRSQSMGMQTSKDLSGVTTEMFNQLRQFGGDLFATGIVFCDKHEGHVEQWHSIPNAGMLSPFIVPIDLDYIHQYRYDEWNKGSELFEIEIPSDFIEQHFQGIFNLPSAQKVLKDLADQNTPMPEAPPWEIDYGASFKHGYLLVSSLQRFKEVKILPRFAKVFEQAYTRFLDLKKAEAQARESQIEAALEKVRSRSLAMRSTNELKEVVVVIVEKLTELGVILDANGITLCTYFPDSKDVLHWIASPDFSHVGKYLLPYFDHVIFKDAWQSKEQGDSYFSKSYSVEDKNSFFKHAFEHSDYKNFPEEIKQWIFNNDKHSLSFAWQKNSAILIPSNTGVLPTDAEREILIRFSKVFEQAYIRFMDLQKAEAQAREAQIETALEKVRSRTMAMQHSDELPEAANNLFLQVQALGIPAWSAGYCIWEDESKKSAWCNMSSEGEIQKGFSLPTIGEGYDFYKPLKKKQDFYVTELGGKALVKHYDFMKKLPIVGEVLEEFSQKGIALPTFQIFHIVFFTHGYLMFITYETVPNEWDIFKRFGKVFEQTYTRFLDLKKAEAQSDLIKKEKERLEVTLSELKATQSQLIQSEKMASLGELTAGIAHEIQNPLNFVNNFSEVSKELLDEMLEEIENGDMEEVRAIMDDVIQNLEKINHHGKRADGIVKGMLQHSRSSGNQKEPTNINALADEYLRLAYHGLRAKDKSFNATLETDFDDTLEKIKVIPQDIGRVVLNLLTNAFYAVNEKKQSNQNGFMPTVKLSTKKSENMVVISVKDNGNGIPQKVVDKIFQPFFTTKPTGQGTGLGLSMSYDIVTKGHGGELKVNTKQGEGTEFSIVLPIKS